MKFWHSSKKCNRCAIALKDDLSVEDRRDDLIKSSSLITASNNAGPLCASCRLVQHSSEYDNAPFDIGSMRGASVGHSLDGNYITTNQIINWLSARVWNLLTWAIIIIIALFKFSGITGWFDDEQPIEATKVSTIKEQQIDLPIKTLVDDSAVPFNSPNEWISANDYPARALIEEREGITDFALTISEEGKVSACIITDSSGHKDLDEATCNLIMKRAIFNKGIGPEGLSVKSKYRNRVRWQIPE